MTHKQTIDELIKVIDGEPEGVGVFVSGEKMKAIKAIRDENERYEKALIQISTGYDHNGKKVDFAEDIASKALNQEEEKWWI